MLRQEYVASLSAIYSDPSLPPEARLQLVNELDSEYRRRRAEELDAMRVQGEADAGIAP